MSFQDVAFMPSRANFLQHFIKIVVEVKASGPPHVIKLWLGETKGMLPVKCYCSAKPLFVTFEFHVDHKTAYKDEAKSGHPQFHGYYRI